MSQQSVKKHRLFGFELLRGFAVFAVVIAHSGQLSSNNVANGAAELRAFFSFSVPFFLSTSFYFLTKKYLFHENLSKVLDIRLRIKRLLVPYLSWSLIYLLLRTIIWNVTAQQERIDKLYDIPSILFMGGASFHLYFLSLLLAGTLAFYLLDSLVQHWSIPKALFLLTGGLFLYRLILVTGNKFNLGPNIAFEQAFTFFGLDPLSFPLRIAAVYTVWIIYCLPYIGLAILFNLVEASFVEHNNYGVSYLKSPKVKNLLLLTSIICFLLLSILIMFFTLSPFETILSKFIISWLLVVLSLLLSIDTMFSKSKYRDYILDIGKSTLGIYLAHPIFIFLIRGVLAKVYPNLLAEVSVSSLLLISSTAFLLCWCFISLASRNKLFSRYMA